MNKSLCVLSYSPSQGAFHVEEIDEYNEAAKLEVGKHGKLIYQALLVGTWQECHEATETFGKLFWKHNELINCWEGMPTLEDDEVLKIMERRLKENEQI